MFKFLELESKVMSVTSVNLNIPNRLQLELIGGFRYASIIGLYLSGYAVDFFN